MLTRTLLKWNQDLEFEDFFNYFIFAGGVCVVQGPEP